MRDIIFHALAERELTEILGYYAAQDRPGLVGAFLDEVDRVITLVSTNPFAGTGTDAAEGSSIREWRLRRFPYSIIYRVRDEDIRILAIAAHKRRPLYWRERR